MKEFIHPSDKHRMNWVEGFNEWGKLKPTPSGFDVKRESKQEGDVLWERYTFTNNTNKYLCTKRDSFGIYTPFNDNYDSAEAAYRAVLGLIKPDGRASCAYLFPISVNGVSGEFFDPYANDQDWALYFYLRHKRNLK